MKVLITGGAGFIGLHLAKFLEEQENEVVLVDNFSRGVNDAMLTNLGQKKGVTFVEKDLMDVHALDDMGVDYDIIYHLAAMIGVDIVLHHSYEVLKNNTGILLNILEFAEKQKHLKRFLFASTSEVYAGTLKYYGLEIPTPEETPLTITDLKHPRTSYMLSKIYGEALLHQSKVPYTIFRPHNFYGPRMGMSHVIPELLRKAYFMENETGLEVYSPAHKRTFCYIGDAVEMITRLALSKETIGEAFNIGTETPEYSMREVGEMILKVTGKKEKIIEMPPSPGSPERRCPSMKKTIEVTGYQAKVGLEEGIRKTFGWYKESVFDGKEVCAK